MLKNASKQALASPSTMLQWTPIQFTTSHQAPVAAAKPRVQSMGFGGVWLGDQSKDPDYNSDILLNLTLKSVQCSNLNNYPFSF